VSTTGAVRQGKPVLPMIEDLASTLHFDPKQGHIWLAGRRMSLVHTRASGLLRRETIAMVGIEKARALFTRLGYFSGAMDAEIASKVRPNSSLDDMFAVGPQLHALEGVVSVQPLVVDIDVQRGHFYSEYEWHHSSECGAHVEEFGIGALPAGWGQIGYASGYASVFLGRPIVFRETECIAMGHPCCKIIGRASEDWPDVGQDLRYMRAEQLYEVAQSSRTEGDGPGTGTRHRIVGASAGFNVAFDMLRHVADTDAIVLFLGESGVGKEMFARNLHALGRRADEPFIAVNCAAIPESLIESELFGVEKGAFTGATATRAGRFERAAGGTLFLDEIGSLSLAAQAKLLRVIQEREYERVGGSRVYTTDVRLVAATNVDLRESVAAGQFRQDLFYRLNVFPLRIPPLRERRADIPLMMDHFLSMYRTRYRKNIPGFEEMAISAMLAYDWPGNVRELENLIERAVIMAADGEPLRLHHLFSSGEKLGNAYHLGNNGRILHSQPDRSAPAHSLIQECLDSGVTLEQLECEMLKRTLESTAGNRTKAASLLGITRAQFNYRYKRATR
jgi:two-component system, NtrC family, response regulator HydG